MNASTSFGTGSHAIDGTVDWLQGALLGPIATTIAVVAIAAVGFLMLTGRIDVRRAAKVILGCFIVFGASSIAHGIMGAMDIGGGAAAMPAVASPSHTPVAPPTYTQGPATPYDPYYAGAAVPPR